MLAPALDWEQLHALDLFGGTGSISFELLSRGAQQVVVVEQHAASVAFIRKTAETFHIADRLRVQRGDVFRFLEKEKGRFGLVFADPPYALPQMGALLTLMLPLLEKGGMAVLEHDTRHHFESHPCFLKERKYGDTLFSFFKAAQEKDASQEVS